MADSGEGFFTRSRGIGTTIAVGFAAFSTLLLYWRQIFCLGITGEGEDARRRHFECVDSLDGKIIAIHLELHDRDPDDGGIIHAMLRVRENPMSLQGETGPGGERERDSVVVAGVEGKGVGFEEGGGMGEGTLGPGRKILGWGVGVVGAPSGGMLGWGGGFVGAVGGVVGGGVGGGVGEGMGGVEGGRGQGGPLVCRFVFVGAGALWEKEVGL
ncbi:MAG: hypothetical protein Q9166_002109 [cf. Caloplaca sp. 2 TL-2023]